MVARDVPTRERISTLLDQLPDEALGEVVSFIEFQQFKRANGVAKPVTTTRFKPTPMGGLWNGVEITEADIAEARQEMWGRFREDDA